jgi:hypothetical protein
VLNGQYAFNLYEYGGDLRVVGSFIADGSGNVSVELDANGVNGGLPVNLVLTGTYQITSTGEGDLELTGVPTPDGVYLLPVSYKFFMLSGNQGRIISEDIIAGSGMLVKQDPTAFSNVALNGTYLFHYNGSSTGAVGMFTADGQGNLSTGVEDVNSSKTVSSNLPLSGSYNVGSNGRGTATLVTSLGSLNLGFYVVSASKLLFVSTDSALY